ncbi:hypothetical protein [Nostoc sp.]|uniref:hypothetical protein n=1 Tax=Nostoc sp. TaxID=1180 RepID=UPI002FF497F9
MGSGEDEGDVALAFLRNATRTHRVKDERDELITNAPYFFTRGYALYKCLMPDAQCPMPNARCPISEKNVATCNSFLTL